MYGYDECEYDYNEAGMGILPLVGASGIVKSIGGLFGGGNPKDASRLATNLQLYNAMIAGDAAAAEQLRLKAAGAWATERAKADARQKYASALQILSSQSVPQPGAYPQPNTPATVVPGNVSLFGNLGTPILLGGAAIALFMFTRSKRR